MENFPRCHRARLAAGNLLVELPGKQWKLLESVHLQLSCTTLQQSHLPCRESKKNTEQERTRGASSSCSVYPACSNIKLMLYQLTKETYSRVHLQENKAGQRRGSDNCSIHFSHSVVSDSLRSHGLQHARLPCPSPTPGVCSNSCPLSWSSHLTISSSVILFCLKSFPASGSFQMSQFFTSGGQTIGVSASASVLTISVQDRFPLGWTGWISLQSKELSRVFSNTTVQKHHCFGA